MRYQLTQMQSELVKSSKETTTGVFADTGLALGSRSGRLVSLQREADSLQALLDSNGIVSARFDSTQKALEQLRGLTQDFTNTLVAAVSSGSEITVAPKSAEGVLESMTAILNYSQNGEYLFAGVNTDEAPLKDFVTARSATVDAEFLAHFGFSQNDPQAGNITGAQMEAFLASIIEPNFLGAGWETNWSNASNEKITTRISLKEKVEASATANGDGVRRLAMAAATVSSLLSETMSEEAKATLLNTALGQVGSALQVITSEQTTLGVAQNRLRSADDRLGAQKNLLQSNILDLQGVDTYEAAARVATLQTQIETSYALTARLQNLSILNYLT